MAKKLDSKQDSVSVVVKYKTTEYDLFKFFETKVKETTGKTVDLWSTTNHFFTKSDKTEGYFKEVWLNMAARNVKAQVFCVLFDYYRKVEKLPERKANTKVDAVMDEFEKAFT